MKLFRFNMDVEYVVQGTVALSLWILPYYDKLHCRRRRGMERDSNPDNVEYQFVSIEKDTHGLWNRIRWPADRYVLRIRCNVSTLSRCSAHETRSAACPLQ